ncbi:hypothetical protein K435DRAFT_808072, partial [Dendrothele bispora CBS 962.96]
KIIQSKINFPRLINCATKPRLKPPAQGFKNLKPEPWAPLGLVKGPAQSGPAPVGPGLKAPAGTSLLFHYNRMATIAVSICCGTYTTSLTVEVSSETTFLLNIALLKAWTISNLCIRNFRTPSLDLSTIMAKAQTHKTSTATSRVIRSKAGGKTESSSPSPEKNQQGNLPPPKHRPITPQKNTQVTKQQRKQEECRLQIKH